MSLSNPTIGKIWVHFIQNFSNLMSFVECIFPSKNLSFITNLLQNAIICDFLCICFSKSYFYSNLLINARTYKIKTNLSVKSTLSQFLFSLFFEIAILLLFCFSFNHHSKRGVFHFYQFKLKLFWCLFANLKILELCFQKSINFCKSKKNIGQML